MSKITADPTEEIRRLRQAELNAANAERAPLEEKYGKVWDTEQLVEEFEVLGFMAPLVVVRRRADGQQGSLEFQHSPRLYFNWQAYTK